MRTMNIGRLNKRITFYTRDDTVNELNQKSKTLKEGATVWASIVPLRDYERYELQKAVEERDHRIYVRYLPGIKADMFIKYKDTLLEIKGVDDVELEGKMLEISAKEIVDKGYVYG